MSRRLSVVVSQGQSNNPTKRQLEENIVAELMFESGIDVTIVPHLYDLKTDGTGILALQGIPGDMVVLSWMYSRAAHWILDRNGIHGKHGTSLLRRMDEDEEEEEIDGEKPRVIDERLIPNRKIYCIDLQSRDSTKPFIDEIKRIANESTTQVVSLDNWISGTPEKEQLERFKKPTNTTALGPENGNGNGNGNSSNEPIRIEESANRRWYPVIDFSRCTNCMECIDFCLFGVYGVDDVETILVEQPDNCRKGCPACSRVCPENAIIFPQHKSPAIAGAVVESSGLKIDLSKLFGAPDSGESAADVAARERDEQLILAGRSAVGDSPSEPKPATSSANEANDELDDLIDELDELDL